MTDLNRRTAVVTGGATLIGAAVVRALHAAGAQVAVADIDEVSGQRIADELGDGALFAATDIRDDGQIGRLIGETVQRFGGLDIVVNLACSYVDEGPASSREDWLESLNVNVASAVMMAKAPGSMRAARTSS